MNSLNPRQRAAVRHDHGPLLVLAGAGSGKTSVIARKIDHLIAKRGLAPDRIVAITFTNKAAREMRARARGLRPARTASRPWISTFHTFGLRILRAEAWRLGYRSGFSIFDAGDCAALVADLLRRETGSRDADAARVQRQMSAWKQDCVLPAALADDPAHDADTRVAATCYGRYCATLRTYNAVDFDDLIMLPVRLFRDDPEVLAHWQAQIAHLLVDEYQDTNLTQYELVRLLAAHSGQLTVVGDDDQSIYSWRGARAENIARLSDDFPGLEVIKLEQNYRSTGAILKAANHLIANNPHLYTKQLWSDRGFGERIGVHSAGDEHAEADHVANSILHRQLLGEGAYGDFAVLFRSNYQARTFERAFRERNIPYVLSGGGSFFDCTEIKDVVCYLRLLANDTDDNAFLRIVNTPRRLIGAETVERIVRIAAARETSLFDAARCPAFAAAVAPRAARHVAEFCGWLAGLAAAQRAEPAAAVVTQLLQDIDYFSWIEQTSDTPARAERRSANVRELIAWIVRVQERDPKVATLTDVVNALTLFDIADRNADESPGNNVALMTLHAAKGLEFPHVYLVGMEENILPHRASVDAGTVEEERRLAYVGMTRAQRTLTLSFARTRRRYGQTEPCVASRFIGELPCDELVWSGLDADAQASREKGQATLTSLRQRLRVP